MYDHAMHNIDITMMLEVRSKAKIPVVWSQVGIHASIFKPEVMIIAASIVLHVSPACQSPRNEINNIPVLDDQMLAPINIWMRPEDVDHDRRWRWRK